MDTLFQNTTVHQEFTEKVDEFIEFLEAHANTEITTSGTLDICLHGLRASDDAGNGGTVIHEAFFVHFIDINVFHASISECTLAEKLFITNEKQLKAGFFITWTGAPTCKIGRASCRERV